LSIVPVGTRRGVYPFFFLISLLPLGFPFSPVFGLPPLSSVTTPPPKLLSPHGPTLMSSHLKLFLICVVDRCVEPLSFTHPGTVLLLFFPPAHSSVFPWSLLSVPLQLLFSFASFKGRAVPLVPPLQGLTYSCPGASIFPSSFS